MRPAVTRLGVAALAVLALGCPAPNPAIKVSIEVAPAVKSTCIVLVAKSGANDEVLGTPTLRKDRLEAAVYGSTVLSGATTFTARGYWSANGCDEPRTLNDESATATATFDLKAIGQVALRIQPPTPQQDVDQDGFRSRALSGPDCDDTSAAIRPGVAEVCADGRDNNCDGQGDCADSACVGTGCDDGLRCTVSDVCRPDRTCSGTPVQCAPDNVCTAFACNPATGTCVASPQDAGATCDDSNLCTQLDVCLGDGGCRGVAVTCTTPPGPCFAASGTCQVADGGCTYAPLDAGTSCVDADPCTTNDRCTAGGSCTGTPVTCNTPPGQCFARSGTCVPDGGCTYTINTGSTCDDGNNCTSGDTCLADGGCAGSGGIVCNTPPSVCHQSAGSCLPDGGCTYPAFDAGAACSDNNLCTTNDRCTAGATCQGTVVVCGPPPGQCFAASGTCQPTDGGCTWATTPGATCSDSDPCTANDTCLPDAGCASGAPYSCTTAPNACFVSPGACHGDGGCTYAVNSSSLYQSCDAGAVCMSDGGCVVPTFPYAPANFDPSAIPLAAITPSINLNCAAQFDSTPDASSPFGTWCGQPTPTILTAPQTGGPDAVVLPIFNFQVDTAGTLRVVGTRPVIFAVFDTATITGNLFATANLDTAGAGGSSTACGLSNGGAGSASTGRAGGGGGAGFGSSGAPGGTANNVAITAGAAGLLGGLPSISPLRGGCSGGNGGATAQPGGRGGAGGGGVQISSAGTLRVSGVVSSSGGGGRPALSGSAGGGGAGSGGAVLLESPNLTITNTARLTANGGGGGEGANSGSPGAVGQNGAVDTAIPAPGGTTGPGTAGNGGSGGASTTAPGSGLGASQSGGGGGGAVGRIRLTGHGSCSIDPGALVSPPASRAGCP